MKAPTVLIVDDTPATLDVVREALGSAGYRLLVAESGDRALALLALQPVDLVLLDAVMPGPDGFATLAEIRDHPEWRSIPVLLMTGDCGEKVRALESGAADFVGKPILPPEVLARVRTHLDLRAARHELAKQTATPALAEPIGTPLAPCL